MPWQKSITLETFVDSLLYAQVGAEGDPIRTSKLSCYTSGAYGDFHSRMHMLSSVREEALVDKGSLVLNHRQLTITSVGECDLIASDLGLPSVLPEDMMSNIHLHNLSYLSTIYPGSFINFFDSQDVRRQLVVMITAINDPCDIPKKRIENRLGVDSAKGFEKIAYNRRGLVAMVYRPGFVKVGDRAVITLPRIFFA